MADKDFEKGSLTGLATSFNKASEQSMPEVEKEVDEGEDSDKKDGEAHLSKELHHKKAKAHIRKTPPDELEGFLSPEEDRVTVKEAYFKKMGIPFDREEEPSRSSKDTETNNRDSEESIADMLSKKEGETVVSMTVHVYPGQLEVFKAVAGFDNVPQREVLKAALAKMLEGKEALVKKAIREYRKSEEEKEKKRRLTN